MLRTLVHKMQHGDKMDLLIEKRKLSDFGRIICLEKSENRAIMCQETAEILWCIWCIFEQGGS